MSDSDMMMIGDKPVAVEPPLEAVAPAARPPKPILWRVVVEPYDPPEKIGSIALADETKETQRLLTNVGRVVDMGHLCYKGTTTSGLSFAEDPNKPEIGSWVVYGVYGGQKLKTKNGRVYLIVNDDNILAVVDDPSEYQFYL